MSIQTTIFKVIRAIVASSYQLDDYNRFFLNFLFSEYKRLTYFCRSFFCPIAKDLAVEQSRLDSISLSFEFSTILSSSDFQLRKPENIPNAIISHRLCKRHMLCAIAKMNGVSYKKLKHEE